MGRSISIPGIPPRLLQYLVAGFVVFWGVWGVAVILRFVVSNPFGNPKVVIALLGLWLGLTVLWVRRAPSEKGSAWDFIPSWQYSGRFAKSGGIARDEMETALRDGPRDEE